MGVSVKGTVFKNAHDSNGTVWYSYNLSVSAKNMEGEWVNASMPIRFRKGVELVNKSRIEITDGWLKPIEYRNGDKVVGIFAREFETIDGASTSVHDGFGSLQDEDIPF